MAGLAAGIRLAMFDRPVLILERHNAPGGLNSFYFKEGRRYDVGLHAVTNFVPPGVRGTPLVKLLRQLRISRDELLLRPQVGSRIAFDDADLRFANGIDLLQSEVERVFPDQSPGFRRLRDAVLAFNEFDPHLNPVSTRETLAGHITEPLLREMLLCPLMYYGNAREHDMDFDQFVILWKAIFEEGFARPAEGVRVIIRALLRRYRDLGGKRRMKCGVARLIHKRGRVVAVELESGEVLTTKHVLSTAGHLETLRLLQPEQQPDRAAKPGALSFVETLSVLDKPVAKLGVSDTIVFFNHGTTFEYACPVEAVDARSGVICMPGNYLYESGEDAGEPMLRTTAMARYDAWSGIAEEEYLAAKRVWFDRLQEVALRFLPSLDPATLKRHTVVTDMFTPRTIFHYTGHLGGAVYGAPDKLRDGRTPLDNLYLAGTDQGFLGITGAMLSGISMANAHILAS